MPVNDTAPARFVPVAVVEIVGGNETQVWKVQDTAVDVAYPAYVCTAVSQVWAIQIAASLNNAL